MDAEVKAEVDRAISLWQGDRAAEAVAVLLDVRAKGDRSAATAGLCGSYLYKLGRLAEALPLLEEAARHSPQTELWQRALCHCLHDLGRYSEAVPVAETLANLTGLSDDQKLAMDLRKANNAG